MSTTVQEKLNPALTTFKKFIEKSVSSGGNDGSNCTNVYDFKLGSWHISDQLTDEFLGLYEAVINGGTLLNTFERSDDVRGLMIDLDILQSCHNTFYTNDFFIELGRSYYNSICDICNRTVGGPPDRMIITRRYEVTKKDNMYKDGCHIYFPSMRMSKALRIKVLEALKEETVIIVNEIDEVMKLGLTQYSDASTWVDVHAARVATTLLGSCKPHSDIGPHTVIFTGELIRKTVRRQIQTDITTQDFSGVGVTAACALVLKHSKLYYQDYRLQNEEEITKDINEIEDTQEMEEEITLDTLSMQNAEAAYIIKLLDILPAKYYEEYSLWFKVLCALSSFNTRFKCIALWFSKKSKSKFNKSSFESTWESALQGRKYGKKLTKRSIIYWARKECPEKFDEICKRSYFNILINTIMETGGEFSHGNHAKLLYSMLSHKYVYSTKSDIIAGKTFAKCWYEFIADEADAQFGQDYKWRADPEGLSIKKYIMFNYPAALRDGQKFINENIDKINEKTDKEKYNHWALIKKNYKKTTKDAGNITTVERIVHACELLFERREFMNELDRAEDMIGVANGVLKVGAKVKLIRRCHEYPIMIHTPTSYTPYDATSEAVKKILLIFQQVYPEPDVNEYIWTMAATGLDRRPVTGKLLFIIGGGSNGKTATMNFIQNALGLNLCASIKMELLTGVSGSANSADSAFMQAKGKTLLIIDEGSGNDAINSVKVKNLINSSVQSGRDLFERQSNFNIHANSFATTNHEPIIKSSDMDHGFWRRIWFYTAKSKFTSNPDPNRPNEYLADSNIEIKLAKDPLYLNAVLSIMAYYYERFIGIYKGELGNLCCDTLNKETSEYRKRQDKTFRYACDKIICSPRNTIPTMDIGSDYANWARINFNDSVLPYRADSFLANGILSMFKSNNDYVGIRLKSSRTDSANADLNEIMFSEFCSMKDTQKKEYLDTSAKLRQEYKDDIEE